MTEKRFILIDGVKKGTHSGIWDNLKQNNQRVGDELWVGEVVAMLNEGIAIIEENKQLKAHYNSLSYNNGLLHDECINKIDALKKENEQLKQRNTNQYNQLNELWQIIEEENWEKLIAMKKKLKEDEERLQREWKCYE